ncbi:helix-turn-helix domain-containing protein [Methanosarcina lacustris]
MRKGSLYRIYPEEGQKQVLEQHFGGVRFLYNKLLHIKSILYGQCGCSISRSELDKHSCLKRYLSMVEEGKFSIFATGKQKLR